ncbi:GNAT family N-acetyltransferase [Mariniflexile soesokkakense]|uniref:GNAT family N-acetyltransferase n=1 Tax=Mariniflexile soesokkakense TaxID=1343160 RepID=A0ABV0AE00_9FLAO
MSPIKNPFTSQTFVSIWLKHFNHSKEALTFNFIEGVSFVKNKYLPLYVNTGKNLTNGISYTLNENKTDYRKKVFFLYDIPEYYQVNNIVTESLKLKTTQQYKGFLVNLKKFENSDDYLNKHFSSNSRWKIRKSKKRLESSFNIKYDVLYGAETTKNNFDFAFNYFNILLKKRFTEKQINNHYLAPRKWKYLQELIFAMILDKQAALFVISSDNTPISIYLNFVSDKILYSALPVFDTDYSKFNVGYLDNLKHIEWCFENNIEIFDFSKGDYDYKKRLANKEYRFNFHILYDAKSIRAKVIANGILLFFKIKQKLRDKNMHIIFHKIVYFLKGKKYNKYTPLDFETEKLDPNFNKEKLIPIDFNEQEYAELKKIVIDFLYKNSESVNNVVVFKLEDSINTFYIKGNKTTEKIVFNKLLNSISNNN